MAENNIENPDQNPDKYKYDQENQVNETPRNTDASSNLIDYTDVICDSIENSKETTTEFGPENKNESTETLDREPLSESDDTHDTTIPISGVTHENAKGLYESFDYYETNDNFRNDNFNEDDSFESIVKESSEYQKSIECVVMNQFDFDQERFKNDYLYQQYIHQYYPEYYDPSYFPTSAESETSAAYHLKVTNNSENLIIETRHLINKIDELDRNQNEYNKKIYVDLKKQIPDTKINDKINVIIQKSLSKLQKNNKKKRIEEQLSILDSNYQIKQKIMQNNNIESNLNHQSTSTDKPTNEIKPVDVSTRFLPNKTSQHFKFVPQLSKNANTNIQNPFVIRPKKVAEENKLKPKILAQKSKSDNKEDFMKKLQLLKSSDSDMIKYQILNTKFEKQKTNPNRQFYISDDVKKDINKQTNLQIFSEFKKTEQELLNQKNKKVNQNAKSKANFSNQKSKNQINQIFIENNSLDDKSKASPYISNEFVKYQNWINQSINNKNINTNEKYQKKTIIENIDQFKNQLRRQNYSLENVNPVGNNYGNVSGNVGTNAGTNAGTNVSDVNLTQKSIYRNKLIQMRNSKVNIN